jgi:7,8-dihydropterin-6-yl-methyl-4-(beta-D-ribofuranosyl)aminobenzene 5'-phosphate synthase
VLSHGHYDHTGGLPFALSINPSARVYAHPDVFSQRFSIRNHVPRSIKMPEPAATVLRSQGARIVSVSRPTEVLPGVWVTGPIPRNNAFEDTGGPFYLDDEGRRPDPIDDDQAMWIDAQIGRVVVLGCAHAGVVNTLDYISHIAGSCAFHAVFGGMHLAAASAIRLEKTVEALERYGVRRIAPCHCTGDDAIRFLQRRLPGRVTECTAGSVLAWDGG